MSEEQKDKAPEQDQEQDTQQSSNPSQRQVQHPEEARRVDTGHSWLGVMVFLFTTGYLLISFDERLFATHSLMFVAVGVVAAKVLLDIPGQLLHGAMTLKIIKGKSGSELIRAVEKAGSYGTFIKAAIVVASYVATKQAYLWHFMGSGMAG